MNLHVVFLEPALMLNVFLLLFLVVLPPEKAEGCESYLQYLHSEDGEREILRDSTKAPGKKRISLDVRSNLTIHCNASVWDF